MSPPGRIAIVGASLAGLRTAEFLRRGGFDGSVALIGEEPHLPYDRPPLSKQVLRGEWGADRLALRRKEYAPLELDMRIGERAASLDTDARTIQLGSGDAVSFDRLVIATGGDARRLPGQPSLDGLFVLRTLEDAFDVRRAFASASRVVVIGAGFIGAEVAASGREIGLKVAMVEALEAPLSRSLGPRLGGVLRRLHERHGVVVHCDRRVAEFHGQHRVEGVTLDDGTTLESDVVVVGVGMSPAVSWLEGSGLAIDDGVVCDERCEASVPGIFAAGDVANWYNPLFEERMRVEHWTHAVEQARHVAGAIVQPSGEASPFSAVPMFWSDQYDIKIQGVGRPRPTDDLVLTGGPDAEDRLIALYGRGGRLMGAVAFNRAPKIIALRRLIAERGTLEAGLEIAES
ncbi:MAG: FAD-dependent oxidoreductase [Polyangiales bacterium]